MCRCRTRSTFSGARLSVWFCISTFENSGASSKNGPIFRHFAFYVRLCRALRCKYCCSAPWLCLQGSSLCTADLKTRTCAGTRRTTALTGSTGFDTVAQRLPAKLDRPRTTRAEPRKVQLWGLCTELMSVTLNCTGIFPSKQNYSIQLNLAVSCSYCRTLHVRRGFQEGGRSQCHPHVSKISRPRTLLC